MRQSDCYLALLAPSEMWGLKRMWSRFSIFPLKVLLVKQVVVYDVQWIQWSPTGIGTRPGVPAPCVQRVGAFLVKKDSISCSWLHLLKVWSLLKTRGDSNRQFMTSLQ